MTFYRPVFALCLSILALFPAGPLQAEGSGPVHGLALHGEPRYPADFKHFDYVDPDAPKGGEVKLATLGGFDTFNPFSIKGQPAAGIGFLFETLTTQSLDEPFSEYGLLAESIEIAPDRSAVTYELRPEARFHDGSPVTADDVIFSFEILKTRGAPLYRFYYANVERAEKQGERRVRFVFSTRDNRELPLIMGQLPVLSRAWWGQRDFEATTLEVPVGSGPYRIERFEPGRYVAYRRDDGYWGWKLPVNRGQYNFERIRYDYYRDETVALEAFKAGAYDWRAERIAKNWATAYDFPAVRDGRVKREELRHQRTTGMQGYAFNLRRPLFQDRRVRQALGLAFDFEWSNQNLFYGQYIRTRSFFDNSELAATGLPSAEELKILEPFKAELPPEVFTREYQPPVANPPNGLRDNLRQALELLQQAGWTFKERKLVDAAGQPFSFEILLDDPSFERVTLPFAKNLERLGIEARVRTVDSAQYINRLNDYDFDMTVAVWGQSQSPGNEQREFWGSNAADQPGGRNLIGIKNPVVDRLIESLVTAPDRPSLVAHTRALDRVLQWHYYVIPHWHSNVDRIAYWDKFGRPAVIPRQGVSLNTWWVDAAKVAALGKGATRAEGASQ
ncbi:MAG TPA: extracellular solute-binding protein [Candidatus Competibacteraceae bacterium]|nr:extracellular solute-binding protein [Candidatus Competibacteraceae bacterium]